MSWIGPQGDLYSEAMRVVPALAKHRLAGRRADVSATLTAYLRSAVDLDIPPAIAWAVLNSAHMNWVTNLFSLYAEECKIPVESAVDHAIASAADWVSNGT